MPHMSRMSPRRRRPLRTPRLLLSLAVLAASGLLAGCPPQPPPLTTRPHVEAREDPPRDAPRLGTEPVTTGIFEPVSTHALDPEALEKARLDRDAILERVRLKVAPPQTQPAATQVAATRPATTDLTGERSIDSTPPLAVKFYLQGRERFLQGANSEAMDQLEKALQLDPEAFTVLRLMGRVCFAASQLARGSMYLERAHRLRPGDVETNYLLGRYWLERKDFDRAVYYLMLAEDSPEREPTSTQTPLSAFYLARAFQSGGYHLAAAKEFERFMALATLPVPGYRYDRELSYLIDEQWASALASAENFTRVGEYAGALPHYERAALAQPRNAFILSRYVNALVQAGKPDLAREKALAFVANSSAHDDAIKLLGWAYRASGHENDLVADLRKRMTTPGSDRAALALTLSMTQEYLGNKADAFATLRDYLRDHRTNLDVLGRLLKRVDSPASFWAALDAAGAALDADRALHSDIIKLFLPLAESAPAAAAVKSIGSRGSASFGSAYLWGLTAQLHNAESPVIDQAFQEALRLAPDFLPARDAFVTWLLAREEFPRATSIVQSAVTANPDDPHAWMMLVRAEAAQQRYLSALKLAQDARAKFPANTDVRMELVNIYRLRGQDAQADAELNALINEQPKNETPYRALINAMMLRSRRSGGGQAAMAPVITLLSRMNRELPNSRFAQIHSALFFARGGRLEDSETIFRRLLADSPEDPEVLVPLSQIRQALGQTPDAIALLTNALKVRPQPDLVRALVTLYREDEKPAEALVFARRIVEENPGVEAYMTLLAAELATQDKTAEAIDLLKDAVKRFPRSEAMALALARLQTQAGEPAAGAQSLLAFIRSNGETTERLYALSHFYSAAGDFDASTASLQRILAIMPDHIGANNDLGYFWVDAGLRLADAEKMIQKAIENEPNNSAFLDSLGWLYYKQGRFNDAVVQLTKALSLPGGNEPEVIQHLADALYRVGRTTEAVERWRQAREMLGADTSGLTPHEKKNRDYLDKVISTSARGDQPELTPIANAATRPAAESDATKAAGPVSPPATLPQ